MRQMTTAQIDAMVTKYTAEFGEHFYVAPNGYGIRVECKSCHNSATYERAFLFARNHTH